MDNNILTGQFVRIEQTPAKSSLRLWAFIIDVTVVSAYCLVTSFLNDYLHIGHSTTVILLSTVLPILAYQPLCESLSGGQTLGKYLLRTRVVRIDGSSASVGDILLRWLLMPVDLAFFGGIAAFSMLVTPRRQRLGDLAAGTMVIRLNTYDRMRVQLDEFRFVEDGYQPTYEEARNLTETQADLIARTLADRSTSRRHRVEQLARELHRQLLLPGAPSRYDQFLTTLLSDYRYYDLNSI